MTDKDFDALWNRCLAFNVEQKPEEFRGFVDLLDSQKSKRWALEIGSNYGGTTLALCEIYENVVTLDIKAHDNFEELRRMYPGYRYIVADSTSNSTVDLLRSLGVEFDFVFIDGDHSYEVAKSDWDKYRQFCSQDGLVAFHDIVYSEQNRANRIEVDILWDEIKSSYSETHEFVSPVRDASMPNDNDFHRILSAAPYDCWGGIGVVRNEPVAVFSHNYLDNNWQYVVRDQLGLLVSSGLYKRADRVHYGVYSESGRDLDAFREIVAGFDSDAKVDVVAYPVNEFEFPTLSYLQSYCASNPRARVLYYHSKGTSRPFDYRIDSWRRCLEHFTTERWADRLEALKGCEVSGPLYEEEYRIKFDDGKDDVVLKNYFSGNFWWARAAYVKDLPSIMRIKSEGGNRTDCELWVGKGWHRWNSPYRVSTSSYYETYFDPSEYRVG